jgi:hypothetical protein
MPPHLADAPTRPILVQPGPPPPAAVSTAPPMQPFPPPLSAPGPGAATANGAPPQQRAAPQRPATVAAAGSQPAPARPSDPDFSNLPPAIAESLARLAGVSRK